MELRRHRLETEPVGPAIGTHRLANAAGVVTQIAMHDGAIATARIDGGEGKFRIDRVACQIVTEQRLTPEEIAELRPHVRNDPRYHHSIERRPAGSSNGITPLAVDFANEVLVDVLYAAEDLVG